MLTNFNFYYVNIMWIIFLTNSDSWFRLNDFIINFKWYVINWSLSVKWKVFDCTPDFSLSQESHFRYLFLNLDLFITGFLSSFINNLAWLPLILLVFKGARWSKIVLKILFAFIIYIIPLLCFSSSSWKKTSALNLL